MISYELVRTYYLDVLEIADEREEPIKLRLEVLKSTRYGTYHPRLFRLETYSLRTSFGTQEIWGKEIIVTDDNITYDEISADSIEDVLFAVAERLPFKNFSGISSP